MLTPIPPIDSMQFMAHSEVYEYRGMVPYNIGVDFYFHNTLLVRPVIDIINDLVDGSPVVGDLTGIQEEVETVAQLIAEYLGMNALEGE